MTGLGWATEVDWHKLPDPTRPYKPVDTGTPQDSAVPDFIDSPLRLTYTFVSPRQRLAVINGKRYRIGESIAGYRVSAIWPNHVELSRGQDKRALSTTVSALTPTTSQREN
ncbi:MAG: hypothetical protein AABY83_01140 [Pseudomonadota bacterium]